MLELVPLTITASPAGVTAVSGVVADVQGLGPQDGETSDLKKKMILKGDLATQDRKPLLHSLLRRVNRDTWVA